MTANMNDSAKRMLLKYKFGKNSILSEDNLTCTGCKILKFDVYQAVCGCIYCHSCISHYIKEENKYCVGGKVECIVEPLVMGVNAFKNANINRKILKLNVKCPQHPCTHVFEISKMEDHLKICDKTYIKCPFEKIGCISEENSQENIENHLTKETLVHTNLLLGWLDNINSSEEKSHRNEMKMMKQLELHEDLIQRQKITFENLNKEWLKKEVEMKEEITNVKNTMKEEMKKMKEVVEKEINKMKEKSKNNNTQQNVDIKKNNIILLNENNTKRSGDLRSRSTSRPERCYEYENVRKSFNERRWEENKKFRPTFRKNTSMLLGGISWTLDKFSKRMKSKEYIFSEYFYSHSNGYKLKLEAYPGGLGDGKNTHLTLYIVICKGECDDILSWPCRYTFKISIINQSTKEEYKSVTINYDSSKDEQKPCFNKPSSTDNVGYMFDTFMSHQDLDSFKDIKINDSLIILCIVSAPN